MALDFRVPFSTACGEIVAFGALTVVDLCGLYVRVMYCRFAPISYFFIYSFFFDYLVHIRRFTHG